MVFVMHLPDLVFVWLSWVQPTHLWVVSAAVGVEQFGYGFGFTAYMMFMMWMAQGEYKTAHYAIGTGIMALGMMVPGFFAGWIQTQLGYQGFFLWVVVSTVPGFLVAAMVDVEPEYGRRG
jgi:PAT family beta-lactamase induction signal transducer AmpG